MERRGLYADCLGFDRLFLYRWNRIRFENIFSIILEMNFRFETGLLFFMLSLDSDGSFNKGVMPLCDTFKTSWNEPDSEDKLTMFVMGVSSTSRQDFNNLVGNGSRSQDLSWEERIYFLTSSAVAGSNNGIEKLISGGGI